MKNLKEQLIRLGHQNPSLRRHLTPILDEVSRSKSYRDKSAMSTRETQLKNLDRGDIFMVEDWDTREWIRYKVDRKRGGAVDVIREDTRKKDRMDGEMKVLKVYE